MVTSTSLVTAKASTDLNLSLSDTDYNDIQYVVYNILGNGAGQSGYGRTLTSVPKVTGDLISHEEWATLKLDILKCAVHQGISSLASITSLPTILEGQDILVDHANVFIAAANDIVTNKFLLGASQYSDENLLTSTGVSINQTRTTPWGSASNPSISHAFTIDFGSSDNARYFFNSGSSLRISGNFDYTLNTPQNRAWGRLLSSFGIAIFNHTSTTADAGTAAPIGFYDLTTTDQTVFSVSGSGSYVVAAYGSNNYEIKARCDVPNNINGGARYMYVTILFHDYHEKIFPEQVDGTLNSYIAIRRSSGSYVSVQSPSATNTVLLTA